MFTLNMNNTACMSTLLKGIVKYCWLSAAFDDGKVPLSSMGGVALMEARWCGSPVDWRGGGSAQDRSKDGKPNAQVPPSRVKAWFKGVSGQCFGVSDFI